MRSAFIVLLACIAFVIGSIDTEYDEYSEEKVKQEKPRKSVTEEKTTTEINECQDFEDEETCQKLKDEGKCDDDEAVFPCLKTCGVCSPSS